MCNSRFEIIPLASSLGAEIRGVDLKSEIPPAVIRALKAAWVEYGVLLFRNQIIDDETQVRFARQFGLLQRFPPVEHVGLRPVEVFRAANTYDDGRLLPPGHPLARLLKLNWLWHTDSSYHECPIAGVILRGVRIANKGGETVFANLRDAYEALPQKERNRIETLQVRHSFEFLVRHQDLPELGEEERGNLPHAVHSLVRRHANGRRSMFLSPPYMEAILDWSEMETRKLIEMLTAWATQKQFLYVHRWRKGDVVMWDNAWTMHKVMPYPIEHEPRVVHGVTILEFDLAH